MTSTPATTLEQEIEARLGDALAHETRPGYAGYRVEAARLVEAARTLRDDFHYDYLSCVTGVDQLPEGKLEVVYHLFRTRGGGALVLHTLLPRDDPHLPSLVPLFPGAELQEREAYDMYGIRFDGHPDLRRILMWEGFAGWPMRKDWKEAFYEQEGKPFDARWPGGRARRSEDQNPFGSNVEYPAGFTLEGWVPEGEDALYASFGRIEPGGNGSGLRTDRMLINLGPQHPSTHGIFRMVAVLEGETIIDIKPVVGYLHRNHEKIGERNTFLMNMPFTDRLDYINSLSNNFGYALAVEKLMGIRPPERAEYIRVIMAELGRISNHLWFIGFLLNDLGAYFTPALYAIQDRELILDLFEAITGSRMMCNYFRFGGVARDFPEGTLQRIRELVEERLPRKIDELDGFLSGSEILRGRAIGVGVLPPDRAIAYAAAGPVLRASGVAYDVRRAEPYGIYDRFDFNVAVRTHGDVYDRYLIRLDEMRESLKILRQALRDIPAGEIQTGKAMYQVRVPAGESYARVDGPKGELGFYIVSNGKPNPWRYHVRPPSFISLTPLGEMCRGQKIADAVVILGSIDITLGEVDR